MRREPKARGSEDRSHHKNREKTGQAHSSSGSLLQSALRSVSLGSACTHGSGELGEHLFGGLPANAGVGHRLAVGELTELAAA